MGQQNEAMIAQKRMEDIFDAYFAMSDSLRDDVSYLLDRRQDCNPVWRRAFIRAVVPLIEGLTYSYLCICHADPNLSADERVELDPNRKQATSDRIKLCLNSIFSVLDIAPAPDFSGKGWCNARRLIGARDMLMHPKGPESLEFGESDWKQIYDGTVWLLGEFFRLPDLMQSKFGRKN